jgi:adenylate kinase
MTPQTFIFIGKSGCGKGTQADKLKKYLANLNTQGGSSVDPLPVFNIGTGKGFRELIADQGYTNDLSRKVMISGARQPDFLAVWIWSSVLVANAEGKEHWILDGLPRSVLEAQVLDTAIKFYQRNRPHIIYLNTSTDSVVDRLKKRGREDDKTEEDIKKRLDWYETDVKPVVEFYRGHSEYVFLEIDGEKNIDGVWQEVVSKLQF